ncbi:MAG: 50S ribosomal protein L22 [Candidatus Omnitrophota bacterium]
MKIIVGKATERFLKVSPRKVRQVIELVRNQEVESALEALVHLNKGAAKEVRKAIQSALASARQNPEAKAASLYIAKITADEGPTRQGRRWRATAMGRAVHYRRRQTHLCVELGVKK